MTKRFPAVLMVVAALMVAAPLLLAADDGKAMYDAKCAMCHGKDGVAKTMAKGSGNFNDPKWQDANPAAAVEKIITDGKGKMMPYKDKLTPDQIKALAAYIKSMK